MNEHKDELSNINNFTVPDEAINVEIDKNDKYLKSAKLKTKAIPELFKAIKIRNRLENNFFQMLNSTQEIPLALNIYDVRITNLMIDSSKKYLTTFLADKNASVAQENQLQDLSKNNNKNRLFNFKRKSLECRVLGNEARPKFVSHILSPSKEIIYIDNHSSVFLFFSTEGLLEYYLKTEKEGVSVIKLVDFTQIPIPNNDQISGILKIGTLSDTDYSSDSKTVLAISFEIFYFIGLESGKGTILKLTMKIVKEEVVIFKHIVIIAVFYKNG